MGDKISEASVDRTTVEPLTAADLPELEPLWRSLVDHLRALGSPVPIVDHGESWPRRRDQYAEMLADDASFGLCVRRAGVPIAYAMVHVAEPDPVWDMGPRFAELTSLSVAPGERGRGVGGLLLDEVDRELLARDIGEYVIGVDSVNDGARRFYERRGFRIGYHLMHGRIGTGGHDVASGGAGDGATDDHPDTASHAEA